MSFSITIFSFCKKQDGYNETVERYLRLIKPHAEAAAVSLKSPAGSYADAAGLMAAEAAILRAKVPAGSYRVALSEEGACPAGSRQFAHWLGRRTIEGRPLLFIIGGPHGLSSEFKHSCNEVMSLSPCTFSHALCRVVLLEQIYRAFTILKGHPYHK
jgi:23S rRNA (pseudouridine1915-N3)-methyltransferase